MSTAPNSSFKTGHLDSAVSRLQATRRCDLPRAKILVVDDEIDVVTALTLRLKHAGYEVYSAFDGASASKAVLDFEPDLVILDIGMPCGDGHAVARGLTDHLDSLLVPVIFLTARTGQSDREKAQSIGAAGYITKPYTSQALLKAVSQAFSWKKPLQGE